jgi:hypothetical protein
MLTRTKLLVSAIVAGSALAAAIPASAQSYPQHDSRYDQRYDRDGRYDDRDGRYDDRDGRYDDRDGRYDRNDYYRGNANAIWRQIEQLRIRIQRTDGRDRISEREAAGLRRAVYSLQQQFRDFNRNGLSQRESQYLQQRINQIRERLRYERRDDDGRRW